MPDNVQYTELLPHEFRARLAACPVGYLPLGTLEWHGEHCALGADALIAGGLFARAAQMFGGIVFPPLFLGPDRAQSAGEILPDGGDPLPDDQDVDDAERLRGIDLGPGNDSEHGEPPSDV